jgi:hypothetical protein
MKQLHAIFRTRYVYLVCKDSIALVLMQLRTCNNDDISSVSEIVHRCSSQAADWC